MEEYRSNSNKSEQMAQHAEKKRVESVVAGGAKVKKKGESTESMSIMTNLFCNKKKRNNN